jgi:hypothetical protein
METVGIREFRENLSGYLEVRPNWKQWAQP